LHLQPGVLDVFDGEALMSLARTRKGRVKQMEGWLRANFPTPYPVKVKFVPFIPCCKEDLHFLTKVQIRQGIYGECQQFGRYFLITLSEKRNKTIAQCLETLMHEWAHASTTRHDKIEARRKDHDPEYALEFGRIYSSWHDEGGCEASGSFPWK
jgi:hypothetical protein